MSKKETLLAAVFALGLLLVLPLAWPRDDRPEPVIDGRAPLAWRVPDPVRAEFGPGGARRIALAGSSLHREPEPRAVTPAPPVIWCDGSVETLLGDVLRRGLRCDLERASRRDVIDHVLTGHAGVGILTIEPSPNERRLGARDFVIGAFEPVCVVDPRGPRIASEADLRAVLSGQRRWPWMAETSRIVGPPSGPLSDLFAELLIPGDRLAITEPATEERAVLDAVRGRPDTTGILHRAAVPDDGTVAILEIDGFRPALEVRVVFRNEHDPSCAALQAWLRSPLGREQLGRVLTLR